MNERLEKAAWILQMDVYELVKILGGNWKYNPYEKGC